MFPSRCPPLAWAWTPFLTTHRRAGVSTASSPSGPTSGRTVLHRTGLLPSGVELQLESYANGRQTPVWMWMMISAIVHRRGGEVGFPHSPSGRRARAPEVPRAHTPVHTPVHTIHTHVHTLFTRSTSLSVHIDPRHYRPGHPAGASATRARHASAVRPSTRRSPQGPAPLTRTATGGRRS